MLLCVLSDSGNEVLLQFVSVVSRGDDNSSHIDFHASLRDTNFILGQQFLSSCNSFGRKDNGCLIFPISLYFQQ